MERSLPSDPYEGLVPISAQPGPTHVIAALPPIQDTTPDQLAFFNRPSSIPFVRHSPLPVAANAPTNAVAKTIAKQVVASSKSAANVDLFMPPQYTVTENTSGGTEDIDVAWLPVAPDYALMGPTPISAFGSLSSQASTGPSIDISAPPPDPSSWALFVEFSDNNLISGQPTGWTPIRVTSSQNIFYKATPPFSAQASLSAASNYGAAILGFFGTPPSFVQNNGGTIVGSSGSLAFPSGVVAGNVLWVVVQAYNGGGIYSFTINDTQGNTYYLVNGIAIPPGLDPSISQAIYICPSANSSGANTVGFGFFISGSSAPDHKEVFIMETGPMPVGPGLPFFRQIGGYDLPPLQDFDGILPVASGGTGTSTPSLVAGSGISVGGSWPNQTVAATGSGGTPGGSTGDVQINKGGGAFGVANDVSAGAAVNMSLGTLALTGGMGLFITGGPLQVSAGASGNISLRTNSAIQIDSNGGSILVGTVFGSTLRLGGSASSVGFFNSSGTTQQTITGSRGGNAALAGLLTALATHNLIVDSTTP